MRNHTICETTGKRRYKTQTSAENAMAQLLLHGPARQIPCRAYPCELCEGWHLSSKPRRTNAAANRAA